MLGFSEPDSPRVRRFRMEGESSIIQPQHLGLANGRLTLGTPHTQAMGIEGLFAPPYASPDFIFDIRLFGEQVKTGRWSWYPNMLFREARKHSLEISSVTALAADRRSAVMRIQICNCQKRSVTIPFMVTLRGSLDYVHDWCFGIPEPWRKGDLSVSETTLMVQNSGRAYAVSSSLPGLSWFAPANSWHKNLQLQANETATVDFTFHIGPQQAVKESLSLSAGELLASAFRDLEQKTEELFQKLPELTAENKDLEAFYNRSLIPLLMNVWQVEEFRLKPYFSTGSVKGGCLASYLWDFSAGEKILPLAFGEAVKQQIKAYLEIDIFKSFAFLPVNGNPYGPWYPVNQEKIVTMVDSYIQLTGDTGFLQEQVNGKSVLSWIRENALFGCREGRAELIDYGVDGESHLELRRGYPYHGILPDLNARRYLTFMKAARLCCLGGLKEEAGRLHALAKELKALVRRELWDEENGWFRFIADGQKGLRYTVQMYKLCDSEVLEPSMLDALLAHLNEEEFLSDYGLHSMSKKDPAYDQADIDNGGGGICTIFPVIIAEKLYRAGRFTEADDMMRRILWWGTRMPYWGDSFAANLVDYRQDTPLQCTIGSVAGAQYILFGILGVQVEADGGISVRPHLPDYTASLSIRHFCLRGIVFDIDLFSDHYELAAGSLHWSAPYGERRFLRPQPSED